MKITCGDITVELNTLQCRELDYLARWRADLAYITERWGKKEPEAEVSRKSVEFAFTVLDRLHVPFWLQNAALAYGEDWRNRQREGFEHYLTRMGYEVAKT